MRSITIALPFPPSTNNLYINASRGGRCMTQTYRDWRISAGWEIQILKPGKIPGKVVLSIALQRKDKRTRDCTNFIKPIEDLLVINGVIDDDKFVEAAAVRWCDKVEGATVTIVPALEGVVDKFALLAA